MFYCLRVDRPRGRFYCRASGLWDVPLADRFLHDMEETRAWALASGKTLSILTDLTGLPIHPQEVAPIVGRGASMLAGLPIDRYAMIVPGSLMRMQVRRIDPLTQRRFFDSVEAAVDWLGWDDFTPVPDSEAMPVEGWDDRPIHASVY